MKIIAIRDGEYFSYNGQWSFEFDNIQNVNVQVGMLEEPFIASRNIKEIKVRGRNKPYFIEVEESPISLQLNFGWQNPKDTDAIREVARWLHQDYFVEFFTSSTPTRIFYVIPANADINYIHNSLGSGYISLTLRNISNTSYSPVYVKNYSELDFSAGSGNFTIINYGDLVIPIECWIQKVTEGGTVTITNNSDGGKVFGFDSLVTNEIVYTDNEDLYIETDEAATYRYDNRVSNFEPLKLIRGNNNFVVSGKCKLQLRYQFQTLQG